ncbi:MAG: hypothetical protein PSX80_07680 [bacterium]|nr:hypothetical protein [bacterium]
MASASLDFGIPVFKAALATRDPRLFDIDLYGTAAYGLATRRKTDHWAWMFQNIPAFPGHGRVAESIVFDLAANFGDMSTVSDIKVAVERKPELAVSASFALSRIGGREAQETIENWLRDPELSKREEKIASGWVQGTERFSNLFKQALDRMKARTPASRSPRN